MCLCISKCVCVCVCVGIVIIIRKKSHLFTYVNRKKEVLIHQRMNPENGTLHTLGALHSPQENWKEQASIEGPPHTYLQHLNELLGLLTQLIEFLAYPNLIDMVYYHQIPHTSLRCPLYLLVMILVIHIDSPG